MKKNLFIFLKITVVIFLFQLFFGLIFMLNHFEIYSLLSSIPFELIASLFFVSVLVLIQTIYLKAYKQSLKDLDLNPIQKDSITVDYSKEKLINLISHELPYKLKSSNFIYDLEKDIYTASTGATMRSWGEKIILRIKENELNITTISILSKPSFPLTLFDYGKSQNNMRVIKNTLALSEYA